jgi:hypothetical protein
LVVGGNERNYRYCLPANETLDKAIVLSAAHHISRLVVAIVALFLLVAAGIWIGLRKS